MKALSVKQPWANLIASGRKTIETRLWPTRHRGELLIVSSQRPRIEPFGMTVCLVELYDCRRMTWDDHERAHCPVYTGAWAWLLRNIRPVRPIAVRGQLKIFEVDGIELELGSPAADLFTAPAPTV